MTPARLAEIRRMATSNADLWSGCAVRNTMTELLTEFDHVCRSNDSLAAQVTRLEAEVERLTLRLDIANETLTAQRRHR